MRYCNAGHPPPCLLRADGGVARRCRAAGCRSAIEDDGQHEEREVTIELGDVLFAATDGLLETRREGAFFGDDRLPELLAEHGRTTPPQALAERVFAAAQEWAPVLHDDVVVLALRRAPEVELRDEPASSPAAQALYAEYQALVRERLGPDFEPTEDDLRHRAGVRREPRAAFVVLYARGRPVALRRRALARPGAGRDQAHVRDRRRARPGPRRGGCWPSSSGAPRAQGARRVRLLTTEVLTEARALYASAGYAEAEVLDVDGRRDVWLEKHL